MTFTAAPAPPFSCGGFPGKGFPVTMAPPPLGLEKEEVLKGVLCPRVAEVEGFKSEGDKGAEAADTESRCGVEGAA